MDSDVGILFSDIEGSTRLLQELGPAYADVLEHHHNALRGAFRTHGGEEEGNEGDSFFVVFPTAAKAVAAALDGQRALAADHWPHNAEVRVRMGVHTGQISRVGAGLIGMAIHEAARIMSAGHGSQVLVSDPAVGAASSASVEWRDLGPHSLKDIPHPMRLWQLLHPDLHVVDFPPLRTKSAVRTNLPAPASSFVGREGQAEEIALAVRRERLVTLTGAGGAGKTRLALRAAADLVDEFDDGVWMVDLAPVVSSDDIGLTVAASLGKRGGELEDLIGDASMLVLLDNCEHLIEGVASLADELLRRYPRLSLLATSREPLGLPGELTWRVPSLDARDAAGLFETRGRAVNAGADPDASCVRSICERLDGIPLAIELAAARLGTFTAEQIAERLDQRFALLASGRRGVSERQRTLQATVDWSYNLLDERTKRLLRVLGVFSGGFSLEAAECVAAGTGLDSIGVFDDLDALVSKSLVVADAGRYRLLETIRQYGLDRLIEGDEIVDALNAHLRCFKEFCSSNAPRLWGDVHAGDSYERTADELDNIRAAMDWAINSGRPADAAAMITDGGPFWYTGSRAHEGYRRVMHLMEIVGPDTEDEAALCLLGYKCLLGGPGLERPALLLDRINAVLEARRTDERYGWLIPVIAGEWPDVYSRPDALEEATRQLDLARSGGHPYAIALALRVLAVIIKYIDGPQADADRAIDEAAAIASEAGLDFLRARLLLDRADDALEANDLDSAWRIATDALDFARRSGDQLAVVRFLLTTLAFAALGRSDAELATALALEGLDIATEHLPGAHVIEARTALVEIMVKTGDTDGADEYARRAAPDAMGVPHEQSSTGQFMSTHNLLVLAHCARLNGRIDDAFQLYKNLLDRRPSWELQPNDDGRETVLGDSRFALYGLGVIAALRRDAGVAATIGGFFGMLDDDDWFAVDHVWPAEAMAQLRLACGQTADYEGGREMSLEDVLALATGLR